MLSNVASDMSESLNIDDLKPTERLKALVESCKKFHVESSFPASKYFNIAEAILQNAEENLAKNRMEAALTNFLTYQVLVRKLRRHPKYTKLPIGDRASFDYRIKEVAKRVKELNEKVLAEYKSFYEMNKFGIHEPDLQSYQELRGTVSTVKTFVSTSLHLREDEKRRRKSSLENQERDSLVVTDEIRTSSASKTPDFRASLRSQSMRQESSSSSILREQYTGMRRSLFTPKQVREFNLIHNQRRIVRGHRTIVVPSRVTTEFAHLSLSNTKKNVETVGYLAGRLSDDGNLVVTHLILPDQIGYSDYFKVHESDDLIKYLEKKDLMTLGWIHSHPVEEPYLSSSDMHYHSVFQSVLQEAIAVVYSPVHMKSVIFNLTPNHGFALISNCSKEGFHTHPTTQPLTMVSQHSVIDLYGDLQVKDIRKSPLFGSSESLPSSQSDHKLKIMFSNDESLPRIKKSETDSVLFGQRDSNNK